MTLLRAGRRVVLAGAGVVDDRDAFAAEPEARALPLSGLKDKEDTGRRRAELEVDALPADDKLPESEPLLGLIKRR